MDASEHNKSQHVGRVSLFFLFKVCCLTPFKAALINFMFSWGQQNNIWHIILWRRWDVCLHNICIYLELCLLLLDEQSSIFTLPSAVFGAHRTWPFVLISAVKAMWNEFRALFKPPDCCCKKIKTELKEVKNSKEQRGQCSVCSEFSLRFGNVTEPVCIKESFDPFLYTLLCVPE